MHNGMCGLIGQRTGCLQAQCRTYPRWREKYDGVIKNENIGFDEYIDT